MRSKGKHLFSEEKKQEIFGPAVASSIGQKIFRSVFHKRIAFYILLATAPHPTLGQGIDLSHGGPVTVTATGGIDWDQAAQTVTARQDAQAVRGTVTVTADSLVAHYRKKATAPGAAAAAGGASPVTPAAAKPDKPVTPGAPDDTGSNEIYRLEAFDHVHIFTPTDQAWGDHGVYDIDRAVLVLTGHALKLVTPSDTMTARDAMEYWSDRHMAVGRGDAVVVTNDGRRVQADVLVGYTDPGTGNPTPPKGQTTAGATGATPVADRSVANSAAIRPAQPAVAKPGADPITSSGKLKRVDAFGHVQVRTPTEIVTGDRGVYIPDTGIARVVGHVHITRGENQLNGEAAIVDMHTGVATLSEVPGARVQGLVVPNQSDSSQASGPARAAGAAKSTVTQKGAAP